jgi:hypothetical protein
MDKTYTQLTKGNAKLKIINVYKKCGNNYNILCEKVKFNKKNNLYVGIDQYFELYINGNNKDYFFTE